MSQRQQACQRCRKPPTKPYTPHPQANYYQAGDICSTYESTSTPVYEVLSAKSPRSRSFIGSFPWKSSQSGCWTSSKPSTSETFTEVGRDGAPRNPRPCVVLQRTRVKLDKPRTVSICLLATFEGTVAIEELPAVLKHFAIPIHPHSLASSGVTHIHVAPDWHKKDTWLIAIDFDSSARMKGRWEDRCPESRLAGGSYQLPVDELARLNILCNQRRNSWNTMCTSNPQLRVDALNEWKSVSAAIAQRRKTVPSAEVNRSLHHIHEDAPLRHDLPGLLVDTN
ncbi:hypothetical protein BD413DRAFT_537228 [Trametes elegans]|nr:hypothetical protein BD413DRAFT_537228 [Trametes elegans]